MAHWGGCERTDHNHKRIVVTWTESMNVMVRVEEHMSETPDHGWIGVEPRHLKWYSGGNSREHYRKARDRARTLAESMDGEIVDNVFHWFWRQGRDVA